MLALIHHYYLFLKQMACHTYTHEISEHRHNSWRYHINKHDIGHTRLEQRQIQKQLLLVRPDLL